MNVLYLRNVYILYKNYNHKLIGFYHEVVVEDLATLFMCASLKPFSTSQGEIFKGKQSLVRATQSGSEGYAVLFFHSPPSVTRFLLPLHNQFDFLSGCAVCVA